MIEVVLVPKTVVEVAPVAKAEIVLSNVTPTIPVPGIQGEKGDKGDKGDPGEQGTPGVGLEDTDDLPEGATNLYFTDARVNALIGGKENTITATTSADYYRGDKTFQPLNKSAVGLSNVENTSDANKPVSTATQTALNLKLEANTPIVGATKTKVTYDADGLITSGSDATTADIADSTNKRYVTDAQLVIIGNTSGTNTGNQTSIVGITGTKAQFDTAVTDGNIMYIGDAPTAHTHPQSEITSLVSDLALKAPLASPTFTGTVSGITKTMVGLGSVDNTADTAKPVSTAQQTALNLKANLASPTFTGTVAGVTASMVGLGNVDNTSDSTKNAAAVTLTNKTISGASNTLSNIAQASVTNLTTDLGNKQATLVSGTNIKTVNGNSLLGSGDLTISGGTANLSYTASPTNGAVVCDVGSDATITAADGTNAGLMLPAQFTKLAGIATGAEVNVNADWNSVSGDSQILNKPTLGNWSGLNYPTYVSGTPFVKMTSAGTFALDTNTYLTAAVTSVAMTVPTGLSISGTPITSSGTLALTLTAGYAIPTTAKQTEWDTSYTNRITSLTTTGTSGAATLIGNTLNIPQYSGGGGSGTVTSVAELTLGTTGTDLSSSVANGTTTPVITLNVPTASAANRGALSAADWTTFNAKQSALTFSTGLTNTGGTITDNLSTGVSGGQSVVGGTASGNNLTLSSTSNATKGKIILGSASAYDQANDRLGLGITSPTSKLHIVGGTLTDLVPGMYFSATMPTVMTGNNSCITYDITTAGSSAANTYGLVFNLLAGYTGANATQAIRVFNTAAGTGTNMFGNSNVASVFVANGTTTGTNQGNTGVSANGNINIGVRGEATTAKNSATNVGVTGFGLNTGTTPIQIGGYFGLQNSNPTFASAALMCDNGSTTSDIFVARDNGTVVWSIVDGGNTTWADAKNMAFNTTTGTKIGTATSQKIGFWNATPIVQPTTAIAASTFVTNTSLTANDSATWDGYTIGQVVKALRNAGILA